MAQLRLDWPVSPVEFNQMFGENGEWYKNNGLDLEGHNGIDFWAPDKWVIKATHDGTVQWVNDQGDWNHFRDGKDSSKNKLGNAIVITTDQQFDYKNGKSYFRSIYGHLKTKQIFVSPGETVKKGQDIALADNSGLSTGPHLHYGLQPMKNIYIKLEPDNGYLGSIDPLPYFPQLPPKKPIEDAKEEEEKQETEEKDENILKDKNDSTLKNILEKIIEFIRKFLGLAKK